MTTQDTIEERVKEFEERFVVQGRSWEALTNEESAVKELRQFFRQALQKSFHAGQESIKDNKNLYKFGDIFTNEINYWMVIDSLGTLRPVVLNKEETKVEGFVGYYDGNVSSIKPFAKYLGNISNINKIKGLK